MIAAEANKTKVTWEEELAAGKEEAKKLAKMNVEEKLQHELEQREVEIAESKRNQTLSEIKSEVSKILLNASLP